MTITLIVQAIIAALQFPKEVLQLAKLLGQTSEEQRQAIMASVQAEADKYQKTGRPSW